MTIPGANRSSESSAAQFFHFHRRLARPASQFSLAFVLDRPPSRLGPRLDWRLKAFDECIHHPIHLVHYRLAVVARNLLEEGLGDALVAGVAEPTGKHVHAPGEMAGQRGLSPSPQLSEVLRQHRPPGGPVVLVVGAPGVYAVGDAPLAEDVGHAPGLAGVLPGALAGGEGDVTVA